MKVISPIILNVPQLIENKNLEKAKIKINNYKKTNTEDIKDYLFDAIIHIMENDFNKSEEILKKGLKKEIYNVNSLYLLGYVYKINKKPVESILTYKKALFSINDIKQEQEIKKIIIELEHPNLDNKLKAKILKYKNQVTNYIKTQLLNPNSKLKISNYVTEKLPNIDINKPRILFGTVEIGYHMERYTTILRKKGYDVFSLNYRSSYLKYNTDFLFDIKQRTPTEIIDLVSKIIPEYDLFHFFFNTTLTLNHIDLSILKSLKKSIIMHNAGTDIRMYSKGIKLNKYLSLAKIKLRPEKSIIKRIANLSKYIDNCIVGDAELKNYVKDHYKNIYILRISRELRQYPFSNQQSNNIKPLIVHAPTHPEAKGTRYILKAIKLLAKKYDFEFILIQNMSHEKAKEIYQKSDIIIDQILAGSYGGLSVEAMAMGKAVICWISDFMKKNYPRELPILSANPSNIEEKIELLLKNKSLRDNLGKKGRIYVEKYHDANKAASNLLDIYTDILSRNK